MLVDCSDNPVLFRPRRKWKLQASKNGQVEHFHCAAVSSVLKRGTDTRRLQQVGEILREHHLLIETDLDETGVDDSGLGILRENQRSPNRPDQAQKNVSR